MIVGRTQAGNLLFYLNENDFMSGTTTVQIPWDELQPHEPLHTIRYRPSSRRENRYYHSYNHGSTKALFSQKEREELESIGIETLRDVVEADPGVFASAGRSSVIEKIRKECIRKTPKGWGTHSYQAKQFLTLTTPITRLDITDLPVSATDLEQDRLLMASISQMAQTRLSEVMQDIIREAFKTRYTAERERLRTLEQDLQKRLHALSA